MLRILANFFDVDPCSDLVLWVSGFGIVEEKILLFLEGVFINGRKLNSLFFRDFFNFVFLDLEVVLNLGNQVKFLLETFLDLLHLISD